MISRCYKETDAQKESDVRLVDAFQEKSMV